MKKIFYWGQTIKTVNFLQLNSNDVNDLMLSPLFKYYIRDTLPSISQVCDYFSFDTMTLLHYSSHFDDGRKSVKRKNKQCGEIGSEVEGLFVSRESICPQGTE